ncbi:LamG domain-containing protein [Leptospira langatensis]|uniref:LamG domain-containing protein n=1 Tax=Leptospira langatensis TaxID=2484983 RepID=A0A5F1ZT51_9LEPT|nr:LamG domain-containing protein [Leptospira langatensis]TGL40269.1 LamG domain-containing protein [Leptospira langatensis]
MKAIILVLSLSLQNCGTYLFLAEENAKTKTYNGLVIDLYAIASANLIHYWPLDGDTEDKIGGLDLIPAGSSAPTVTFDRHGLPGGAYHYPGDGLTYHQSLLAPGEPILDGATSSFTISVWVNGKFNPTSGGGNAIFLSQGGGLGMQYYSNTDVPCLNLLRAFTNTGGTGDVDMGSGCTYGKDGVWYNMIFVWDHPKLIGHLYINGVLFSTYTNGGRIGPWATGGAFSLGYSDLGGAGFIGNIDEIRVYNQVIHPSPFVGW